MVARVPRTRSVTNTRHSEFSSTEPGVTCSSHGEENCSSLAADEWEAFQLNFFAPEEDPGAADAPEAAAAA